MKGNEKAGNGEVCEKDKRRTGFTKQKMVIDVLFTFLKIVVITKARKRNEVSIAGVERKDIFRVNISFAFSYFNSKKLGPRCQ